MSTWISRFAPALLLLFLAGCVGMGLGGESDRVALTDDRIMLVGPRGFCIDPSETRNTGPDGFAVFGNCAGLSGSRFTRQPQAPAVLTGAISEPSDEGGISASLATLPAFFRSPDGARLLSRAGDPETVEVLQSFVAGDVFYLRASDSSPGSVPGVQDTYWRAYFDLGPRIITLSVLALEGEATDEAAQLSVLESFVSETSAANPTGGSAESAAPAEAGGSGLFNSGIFRRILSPERGPRDAEADAS